MAIGLVVGAGPCWLPGGDACAPADDAAELVPADALAYVHVNLEGDDEQAERAAALGEDLPAITGELAARALELVPGAARDAIDFDADVRPWFGGELALALLAPEGRPEPVALFEVTDREGAEAFATRLEQGRGEPDSEVVGDFLVVGDGPAVAAVADRDEAGIGPLADDEAGQAVLDELPDERFATAYASAEGVDELVGTGRGGLSSLAPFVDPAASDGAALSLAFGDEREVELAVRSALDPERTEVTPSFFSAFESFEPEIPQRLPPATLAYLGLGNPGETARALAEQASAQAPDLAEGFQDLLRRLERGGGVDLEEELTQAFPGEAAVALQPAPEADEAEVGAASRGIPYLEFVAEGVDEERAREALAAIANAAGAPAGDQEIEGVQAQGVDLSPTTRLTWAVFEGLAVAATDAAAIAELAADEGGLDEDEGFREAADGLGDRVGLLVYLNLEELIGLAEELGLAEDPAYVTFAGEFRRLRTLGLAVAADDELLTTDARLVVGD